MILKRKIYQKLLDWKRTQQGRCALLIDGARRVGKSYIASLFAKNEYKSSVIIDFARMSAELRDTFLRDAEDLDLFFAKISAYFHTSLPRRDTLFVFDEVQMFPQARQLIKFLVADGRYDYLETGSLISLKQNVEHILIPSEEEHIEMFPLDFEEFLWALDDETTVPFLAECFKKRRPIGAALHRKIMNVFRSYMLVGGMPQPVLEYAQSRDFAQVDRVKKRILSLYRADVAKFAKGYEARVVAIFDQIPAQLSKKEKKYKLSSLGKEARFREYEDAFVWLNEAMIVNPCFNATDPNVGLSLSRDHTTQKCYMADTGLLVTQSFLDDDFTSNELYRSILFDKLNVNEGMLMENIVSQMLRTAGHRLFFYSRRDANDRAKTMEIDFLVRNGGKISPVEVKSSSYRRHSSLDKFRVRFGEKTGEPYILYTKDVMIRDGVVHLPLYMAMFL